MSTVEYMSTLVLGYQRGYSLISSNIPITMIATVLHPNDLNTVSSISSSQIPKIKAWIKLCLDKG